MKLSDEVRFILNGGEVKDIPKIKKLLKEFPDIKLGKPNNNVEPF